MSLTSYRAALSRIKCITFIKKIICKLFIGFIYQLMPVKFYKKSLSLIETSICLLIVGILTSISVSGYVLYENARIQKFIEDIKYYENAYIGFANKYGTIPGNMTFNRCKKFPEFQEVCRLADKTKWTYTDTVSYKANNKLSYSQCTQNSGGVSGIAMLLAIRQLEHSGFIANRVELPLNINIKTISFNGNNVTLDPTNIGHTESHEVVKLTGGKISYQQNARVMINGFDKQNSSRWPVYRAIRMEGGETISGIPDAINRYYNGLIFIFNTPPSLDDDRGAGIGASALFKANIAKKIDLKIDDGLPRRGKIFGLKIYNGKDAYKNNTTVCYDKSASTVEDDNIKAQYLKYSSKERGCNLLYILPDVSEYLY